MKARAHVLVSGRVQGVFFRSKTKDKADSLDLTGGVRNLPDGKVEAVFEGEEESVKTIVDFCRHGPRETEVTNVELTWENHTGEFTHFEVKY